MISLGMKVEAINGCEGKVVAIRQDYYTVEFKTLNRMRLHYSIKDNHGLSMYAVHKTWELKK